MAKLFDILFGRKKIISPLPGSDEPPTFKERVQARARDPEPLSPIEQLLVAIAGPEKREVKEAEPVKEVEPTPEPVQAKIEPTQTNGEVKRLEIGESVARNPDAKKVMGARAERMRSIIQSVASEFGVSASLMEDIAFAESTLDPTKKGPTSDVGLFQFIPTTWKLVMQNLGLPEDTPRTDPIANARAAAWAISSGHINWWNASKGNWGRFY